MTEKQLAQYNEAKARIDLLEEEIYALFEARDTFINPVKRIINTISRTKKNDRSHECKIRLTLEDINALQQIRQRELDELRQIISED